MRNSNLGLFAAQFKFVESMFLHVLFRDFLSCSNFAFEWHVDNGVTQWHKYTGFAQSCYMGVFKGHAAWLTT